MSKEEDLIDSHVSLSQCRKAVEALHSHELKKKEKFEENEILPSNEQHIWLNVTVKRVSPTYKVKPHKIPIVHPLVDPRTTSICLITKDPQREYKDLLESNSIKFISRVVGIEKLKGKFKPFEARRMLLKENGMFLADQRVIPLLPRLLGSKWFEAKKQPIPVCLTRKDLKGELERAISSTYMHQNRGTCSSIKVGKMTQKPSQIVDNIKIALPAIVKAIPGGWDNIQSLLIKTNSSVSLPIWSCSLEDTEGGRWHGLGQKEPVNGEDAASTLENPKKLKSRKRSPPSDDEEEEETPRKKAKPIDQLGKIKSKPTSGESNGPDSVSPPKNQKAKKLSNATKPEDSTKRGKAKTLTSGPTLFSLHPIDIPPKSDKPSGPPKSHSHNPSSKTKPRHPDGKESIGTKDMATGPATGKVVKSPLTIEKAKSKHTSVLEKKKRLMIIAKGGKGIKNAFLGKKVAQ